MVAVKLSAFGGMIPAQDDRLLPQNNSASTLNTFLDAGTLQGMRIPKALHTMANSGYKYAYRIPLSSPDKNHLSNSFWMEFLDPDTNVLTSPVANDAFERFYFTSPTLGPQYNTKARILASSAPFTLGMPTPETAPGVAHSGGTGATQIRSYVYTWISAYGEEGPPSAPTTATGKIDDTWTITLTAPLSGDTTGRNIAKARIYRTITATTGSATFYEVVEVTIATLTYADTISDVLVSAAIILASTDHGGPPADLQGFVSMPNGMIAGFRKNEIWFCEPFLPHAWPVQYTVSIESQIVGLGVVGQTLVILTKGFPYAASGINPANMAFSKIATFEPCMSRGSIVSTAQGVLYASPNGIVLAAYGIVQNASAQLATKDKWLELVSPETLRAARLGASYYAWGSASFGGFDPGSFDTASFSQASYAGANNGILVNLGDPRVAWVELQDASLTDNVLFDSWSGEIFLLRNNTVLWLDMTTGGIPGPYVWRSKVFQLSEAKSLSALRVWFEEDTKNPVFSLNPTRNVNTPQALAADQYGLVRVYIGNEQTLVMTRELRTSGEIMRLPTGFKKEFWQFEIEARVKVFNFEVASSIKELSGV